MIHQDLDYILFSEEQIKERVASIAAEINSDYKNRCPLFIGVLKGSFIFISDLMRAVDINCTVEFMALSSYGAKSETSGQVRILKDISVSIENRDLIVVEDILDSGLTLSYLFDILKTRAPASISLCTLLDKPERRKKPVTVQYSGFSIPDEFVVGYGLDYAERYRNLPYIGVLKPSIYTD